MSRFLAAMLVIVCLAAVFSAIGSGPTKSPDIIRAANSQAAIEACRDERLCIGGFVRWAGSQVVRISSCTTDCGSAEVGYGRLMELAADKDFNLFADLALPNDRPHWDAVAIQYAEQFVWH